jgi:hypothetical protein
VCANEAGLLGRILVPSFTIYFCPLDFYSILLISVLLFFLFSEKEKKGGKIG